MISKKDVEHIAKLARLGLTQKEVKKFRVELSSILAYIEKLKEIDVSKVEPTSHPLAVQNCVRKDEGLEHQKTESVKLLELAPKTKDGYIKVRSTLK